MNKLWIGRDIKRIFGKRIITLRYWYRLQKIEILEEWQILRQNPKCK